MMSLTQRDVDLAPAGMAHLPRVNLLPIEIAARRRLRRVQSGLAGLVVLALLAVGLLSIVAGSGVSGAQGDVDAATTRQSSLQRETATYKDVTATYKRVADAQAMLTAALGSEVRFSRLLNDLALSVPTNVWVSQVTFTQTTAAAEATTPTAASTATAGTIGSVTFTGTALSHEDVARWLESLSAQTSLTQPLLQNESEALLNGKKVVNFSSTAKMSSAALSGRYTTAGG